MTDSSAPNGDRNEKDGHFDGPVFSYVSRYRGNLTAAGLALLLSFISYFFAGPDSLFLGIVWAGIGVFAILTYFLEPRALVFYEDYFRSSDTFFRSIRIRYANIKSVSEFFPRSNRQRNLWRKKGALLMVIAEGERSKLNKIVIPCALVGRNGENFDVKSFLRSEIGSLPSIIPSTKNFEEKKAISGRKSRIRIILSALALSGLVLTLECVQWFYSTLPRSNTIPITTAYLVAGLLLIGLLLLFGGMIGLLYSFRRRS